MSRGSLYILFLVLFLILASLALTLTSIVTDYWYIVDGSNSSNETVKNTYSYHYGMWRKCYEYEIPKDVDMDRRAGKCEYTYQDLIPANEMSWTFEKQRYLHLERSWLGCLIACAGLQIFSVLTLICGLWPAEGCQPCKKSSLYLGSAILSLFACMAGVASGICFIALRDKDSESMKIYPEAVTYKYGWSFMLAWAGTGLCIIEGFHFLCLLKMDYNDVNESKKYNTFG